MDKIFQPNGSFYIENLIKDAIENGKRTATVTGNLEIATAVRLPGDFTLVLENCHLRMADGCYSNMFINEHHDTEIGKTSQGTDRNIKITGKGEAILDGGKFNGLSERTHSKNGLPHISKNNLLLFTNVDGFEISGISCRNQRWWALNFIYCSNGKLSGIDFCSSDIGIDENGNEYHGLSWDRYEELLVKNSDGIDLRAGCHDIVIENITDFTEDDTIALTGLWGKMEQEYKIDGFSSDICNVKIKNINSAALCTNVRLLNQGDIRLHDILIDGVYDTSYDCPYLDRGLYGVRVGDERLYGTRHSTSDETYNITIKNVRSRGQCAVTLSGATKNLVLENIEAFDGAETLVDLRTESK